MANNLEIQTLESLEESITDLRRKWVVESLKAYMGDLTERLQRSHQDIESLKATLGKKDALDSRVQTVEQNLKTHLDETKTLISNLQKPQEDLLQQMRDLVEPLQQLSTLENRLDVYERNGRESLSLIYTETQKKLETLEKTVADLGIAQTTKNQRDLKIAEKRAVDENHVNQRLKDQSEMIRSLQNQINELKAAATKPDKSLFQQIFG